MAKTLLLIAVLCFASALSAFTGGAAFRGSSPSAHRTSTPVHHTSPPVRHTPTPVHRNPTPVHHNPAPTHHNPTPIHHNAIPVHTSTPSAGVPHYSQGNPQWSHQTLGHGHQTIGQAGCLLSSVSAMLASKGVKVNGATPNPGSMNQWLKSHGGFVGSEFSWGSIGSLGFHFAGKVHGHGDMINAMNQGKSVILNVNHGHHYVLATGHDSTGFTVMDPGFSKTHYSNSEVVGAAIYTH